jgi:hypothetical protein
MGKSKKNPVILNENEIDSTLVDLNSLALAIPQSQEVEEKVHLINEIESTAELNKQKLMVERERVNLENDMKKLGLTKRHINLMEIVFDIQTDPDVLERVKKNTKTALDYKLLTEAALNSAKTYDILNKTNTVDEYGNKKRSKINFMFKSNGPIQAAVQIDNSDD